MPKFKTHSATKKRFKITGSGKVTFKKSGRGHLLITKNSKRLRSLKKKGIITPAMESHIKKVMPYA